ncbi:HNH endonuclease [Pelosinus sp. IPA-1]|uniref:HNH endonuclease n=1 Tax=Pelosinus sp. IPA-1 TaxID=3029569 RepID=UPI00243629C0|nr:HNH endonuclease [Pelosinus sp. IPA-1]GMB02056.1 hypothetical protein PIPA1_48560 [Pelosinus sp. IPA-1]
MNYWLIVHDIEAFNGGLKGDDSNTIGFQASTYNAKNVEPGDMLVYYLKNDIALKGIYKVKPKPWYGVKNWVSDYQIDILPVIQLDKPCDFKEVLSCLELFNGIEKWQQKIQGTNGIRELSENDFIVLKDYVAKFAHFENQFSSDNSIDCFHINVEIPPLLKNVGTSQYTDGVRIEKEFHDVFNPPNSPFYTSRGSARQIKILFNNKIFDAKYYFEGQEDKAVTLQSIRFRKKIKAEFQKVFPEQIGQFAIQVGHDLNHFIFSHSSVVFDDGEEFEEDDRTYDETKQAFRLHKLRERKPEVIKKAKDKFLKKHGRLFCQACGFDFKKVYGARGTGFIEGHHTKLVSEMKEGEKTKVEDISLLCSNCHKMIHRKPLINVEQLAFWIKYQSNT